MVERYHRGRAHVQALGLAPGRPDGTVLDRLLAASDDAASRSGAPRWSEVDHVVVTGAGPAGDVLGSALAAALALRPLVGRTCATARGGAAVPAGLRIAQACCRGGPSSTVLVACVADPSAVDDVAGSAAVLVVCAGSPDVEPRGPRIDRVATWARVGGRRAMTFSEDDAGYDLESAPLDLPRLVTEGLGLSPDDAARARWIVDAGEDALATLEGALPLPPTALVASRAAMARHGANGGPAACFALDLLPWDDSGTAVVLGAGPGPTVEVVRLARP